MEVVKIMDRKNGMGLELGNGVPVDYTEEMEDDSLDIYAELRKLETEGRTMITRDSLVEAPPMDDIADTDDSSGLELGHDEESCLGLITRDIGRLMMTAKDEDTVYIVNHLTFHVDSYEQFRSKRAADQLKADLKMQRVLAGVRMLLRGMYMSSGIVEIEEIDFYISELESIEREVSGRADE